jgi:hypothetical protein
MECRDSEENMAIRIVVLLPANNERGSENAAPELV